MRALGYIPFQALLSLILSIHSDSLASAPCCYLLRLARSWSNSSRHAHCSLTPSQTLLARALSLSDALTPGPCCCLPCVAHSLSRSSLRAHTVHLLPGLFSLFYPCFCSSGIKLSMHNKNNKAQPCVSFTMLAHYVPSDQKDTQTDGHTDKLPLNVSITSRQQSSRQFHMHDLTTHPHYLHVLIIITA